MLINQQSPSSLCFGQWQLEHVRLVDVGNIVPSEDLWNLLHLKVQVDIAHQNIW